jgi:hypothetical protein
MTDILRPTEDEIKLAVAEPFDRVFRERPEKLLSALVVIDRKLNTNIPMINYVADREMNELCSFANQFNGSIEGTQDAVSRHRLMALVYCHIMEADLPYMVLWNLLRILRGDDCDWTFRRRTEKGKWKDCQYPKDKIAELSRLCESLDLCIGDVLNRLLDTDFRNAFSHSQYWLDEGRLLPTRRLVPFSRIGTGVGSLKSFMTSEMAALHAGANCYLKSFTDCFKLAASHYKDDQAHEIDVGKVSWTKYGWTWS